MFAKIHNLIKSYDVARVEAFIETKIFRMPAY